MIITKHPISPETRELIKKFTKAINPTFGLDAVFEGLWHGPTEALQILRKYPCLENCKLYPLGISPIDELVVEIEKKLWLYLSCKGNSSTLNELGMQVKTLCSLAGLSDE